MRKQTRICKEFPTGYQQEQKKKNIIKILELIHTQQEISRINIAKELGVDRSTVTTIIPELLKVGILQEFEQKPSGKGGRPPSPLKINPDFGYTLGISIHLKGYQANLLDLNGNLIESLREDLPFVYNEFTQNTITIINRLIKTSEKHGHPLIGAVVSISGTINPKLNSIEHSFVFELEHYDFQKEIADNFPFPILIENDANACAWGELFPQNDHLHSSFLYLLARTNVYNTNNKSDTGMAIGIGVVADGNMIYGAHNRAGELRSALWEESNGNKNQVSIPVSKLSQIHSNETILKEYINEILISLGPVVSVIDPEAIIIGGDLKDKLPIVFDQLNSPENKGFLGVEHSRYTISGPRKGNNEICAGAACMFLIRLFKQDFEYGPTTSKISWNSIFRITQGRI
ncbi:MAG: ROK family transcriptional regulator [Spirochaetia bacterium]|nr:ROK family transcriptional regulator [Bacteroidota bacterium]MBL7006572.1 ROK family transcriptional regulator [Spirochaetia bacterium]